MILSERDREILREYRLSHRKMQQIGDKYGISRERVRQIEVRHAHVSPRRLGLRRVNPDWRHIRDTLKKLRYRNGTLARGTGGSVASVRHILMGKDNYVKTGLARQVFLRILWLIGRDLQLFEELLGEYGRALGEKDKG